VARKTEKGEKRALKRKNRKGKGADWLYVEERKGCGKARPREVKKKGPNKNEGSLCEEIGPGETAL